MAVHMVRVLLAKPKGNAKNAVSNWADNYTEWDNDPVAHELTEANTEIDGTGTAYVRGDWRFLRQGEQPTNILEHLSERLQSFQGGLWHRLGYHVCDHDEAQPTPCSWGEKVEWGDIPSDIPDFEVE